MYRIKISTVAILAQVVATLEDRGFPVSKSKTCQAFVFAMDPDLKWILENYFWERPLQGRIAYRPLPGKKFIDGRDIGAYIKILEGDGLHLACTARNCRNCAVGWNWANTPHPACMKHMDQELMARTLAGYSQVRVNLKPDHMAIPRPPEHLIVQTTEDQPSRSSAHREPRVVPGRFPKYQRQDEPAPSQATAQQSTRMERPPPPPTPPAFKRSMTEQKPRHASSETGFGGFFEERVLLRAVVDHMVKYKALPSCLKFLPDHRALCRAEATRVCFDGEKWYMSCEICAKAYIDKASDSASSSA